MITEKHKIILSHLFFWALHFTVIFLVWGFNIFQLILDHIFVVIPFYINYFILVPYFFKKTSARQDNCDMEFLLRPAPGARLPAPFEDRADLEEPDIPIPHAPVVLDPPDQPGQ